MILFKRNYSILTGDEKEEWEKIKESEIINHGGFKVRKQRYYDYPKAARHYLSLFPNNFLDPADLLKIEDLNVTLSEFEIVLNITTTSEREILNFINKEPNIFIICSVLKKYCHFGHHNAFVIPEFQLGSSHVADYLIIGKSSSGYEFVFIELENPSGKITLQDGNYGETIRKGLIQISDWQQWLEANFISLRELFDKLKHPDKTLTSEFINYDKTRFNYLLIVGRRCDFKEKTRRLNREQIANRTTIIHYDNLIESVNMAIGNPPY